MESTVHDTVNVKMTVTVVLTETEARALDALCGYDHDLEASGFIEHFYKSHGKHYLEPHIGGINSIFKGVKNTISPAVRRIDNLRKAIKEAQQKAGN